MRKQLFTCVLLLTLAGCCNQPYISKATTAVLAARVAADATTTYKLQISFLGLIAFVQDNNKVWALLPNADYDADPTESQLPPGAFAELSSIPATRADQLMNNFPPHRARIRFRNARIVAGNVPDPVKGRSIKGSDVSFSNSAQGISIDFSSLSHSNKIAQARGMTTAAVATAGLSSLDQVDPNLLSVTLDQQRLSARALITAGTVKANPRQDCGNRVYSFKTTANGLNCPGSLEQAVQLAEEVVVTQENVSGQTVITVGSDSITMEPDDPSQTVVVEVVNQIDEALDNPGALLCEMDNIHLEAFRWFYRLLRPSSQNATANHYFPCIKISSAGGAKCPQDLLGNGG